MRVILSLLAVLALTSRSLGVDESLYSRQLYVLGLPAQQRLAASNVLLVGLGGVGVEIAKNLILTGPRSVTLIDPTPASPDDLSCQYYLTEDSVGTPRADACIAKLKELNPHVQVDILRSKDRSLGAIEEAIKATGVQYDVIVSADRDQDSQERLNDLARQLNAKFVGAEARGLCGSVFCDFGDEFTVLDKDGRDPTHGIIAKITQEKHETVIRLVEGQKHDLMVGDVVAVEGAEGLEQDKMREEGFVVRKVINATSFVIKGTHEFGTYKQGGAFRQIKQPLTLSFQPLSRARARLEGVPTDFGKASLDRQLTMLAAFTALPRFQKEKKRLPRAGSQEDAEALVQLAKGTSLVREVVHAKGLKREPKYDEDVLRRFARTSRGMLAPVCSFIGGSAAQEVVKACTGYSMPLQQLLFFDAFEALPEADEALPNEEDCRPRGDRYDGHRAVFGANLVDSLRQQRVFVVGAGAIGCELLKNLALMGVTEVTVTDNDTIERSNLNRQFLFREKDIGFSKSEAAAKAVSAINADTVVTPLTKKVGKETENFFDDTFWFDQDVVLNALDNVAARLYVDGRCVYYRKPLLESGTEGTNGNVQVIVPHVTESYGSSVDPPEASIPVCTLKSFPYRIEHCIQWARDYFDGFFRIQPERLNDLVGKLSAENVDDKAASAILEEMRSMGSDEMVLRDLEMTLTDLEIWDPMPSFRRVVKWALDRFYELYDVNIRALLKEHALDSVDEEGEPFWTGDRKVPTAATFDPRNRLHLDFVVSATLLKGRAFNVLDSQKQAQDIEAMVLSVLTETLPEYVPTEPAVQPNDPAELEARIMREFEEVREVLRRIGDRPGKYSTIPEIFEKDRDENGHMDFVTAASNLRAINYGIAPADRLQTKKIAGRIIPAISTTTSVVAGLASLELYKLAAGGKTLSAYKNAFINLAGPFFALTEPMEATPVAMGENGKVYTMWDRLELRPKRELTLRQFMSEVLKQYGIAVSSITIHSSKIIYADFLHGETDPILDDTIHDLVSVEGEQEKRFVDLEVECADEDGEDVESPPVRYFFPPKRSKTRWGGWFRAATKASEL